MTKKGKIVLAASISTLVVLAGAAVAGVVVCKRIYEKNYFTAG